MRITDIITQDDACLFYQLLPTTSVGNNLLIGTTNENSHFDLRV